MNSPKKNRLANETSAYLLQHAENPVDWYPWGAEALNKAKKENKPIFLSIGYSACHWCHVMEKESFEDVETAAILKNHFISIKVDREERPDLDHIYMAAVQALTQRGGWPLTVFLTPELKPFYGGTYFPPDDRMGMPSFKKLLLGIAGAWKTRPKEIQASSVELTKALSQMSEVSNPQSGALGSSKKLDPKALTRNAFEQLMPRVDLEWGGLGTAPKFFHTMDWRLVLRNWRNSQDPQGLIALQSTLDHWSRGGIYDHLGGGFHRYSTDQQWLAPHFEKMLYDNALVSQLYLEAYQATQTLDYARIARETLDYVIRQMTSPLGGFFSTEDADSEGTEGKFYVWEKSEIETILDPETAQTVCEVYGISEKGNWEETNILHLPLPLETYAKNKNLELSWLEDSLARAKRKLLEHRSLRVAPHRDEKVIVSWNGLMIDSMALAYQVLGDETYLESARQAARFVWDHLRQENEHYLHHSFQDGRATLNAYLDDYAFFANGLLSLFESDFDPQWLSWAEDLLKLVKDEFWDKNLSTFYYTAKTHETLIIRPKEFQDGALPSATAMTITALVRLGKLTGNSVYLEQAHQALKSHELYLEKAPMACGQMLIALELFSNSSKEIVIIPGQSEEKTEQVLELVRSRFYPNKTVSLMTATNQFLPIFKGRSAFENETTVYLCENNTCQSPLQEITELKRVLDG
jgi:uncharacterized protein YyaL (SSP411 family)